MSLQVQQNFLKEFRSEVEVSIPAWINLIGEHADDNNGFIMPMAIDKKNHFKVKKNNFDHLCRVFNENKGDYFEFNLNSISRPTHNWHKQIIDLVRKMQFRGKKLTGFDCILKSDFTSHNGEGLSASLEFSVARGLNKLFQLGFSSLEIAKLSHNAEYKFLSSNFGIMDQFATGAKGRNPLFVLDYKTLEVEFVSGDFKDCALLILDTHINTENDISIYDIRRKECEDVVNLFQQKYVRVKSIRDVSFGIMEEFRTKLPLTNYLRSQFILGENQRVKRGAKALKNGNVRLFGGLICNLSVFESLIFKHVL